jgi:hypothetical protein
MRIASPAGVFSQHPAKTGKIRDDCWACSRPVYEAEPAVCYLGLWLHVDCYHAEKVSPLSESDVTDSSE